MTVAVTVICVIGLIGMAVPSAAFGGPFDLDEDEDGEPFGLQVSTFMQSSAAETDETVRSGMWVASMARNGSNDAVDFRGDQIFKRLDQIEQDLEKLAEKRNKSEISAIEYHARSSRLLGQYFGLQTAIGDAERVAIDRGIEAPGLERAKSRSNEVGPRVDNIARGIPGGVPPGLADGGPSSDDRPGGPPADRSVGQPTDDADDDFSNSDS